jgi:hypothetical protein
MDQADIRGLVTTVHYSHATRGNADVQFEIAGA